jgi:serine-type D-Ala-D-Ala carboxypeptidase/endopeptidase
MRKHMAQAHDIKLNPAPLWNMQALQPAGGFRANVKDVTVFIKACIGLVQTPLKPSLARLLETRRHTSVAGTDAGLGWFISSDKSEEIVWKTGLTPGFNTFIGFSTRSRHGALVLSNFLWAPMDQGTTELGMKLINPDFHPVDFTPLYR